MVADLAFPEAIVLTGAFHGRATSELLITEDIPIIEIADLPQRPIEHAIGFSSYQVGRTTARYLINAGVQRIGAIAASSSGDVVDHRGEERMRGFEEELEDALPLTSLAADLHRMLVAAGLRAADSAEHVRLFDLGVDRR